MRNQTYTMRDPTAETSAVLRERRRPPADLSACTIGLLSISKERSSEFLDTVAARLGERGFRVRRYEKPTHTKPAPEDVIASVIEECDVVVEGLAD